ncbi:MAG: hypothetical protein HON70_38145, partial [Lentisphaerae bacterium]|nr:hypothetical protein [Lentisphaerota bacterium]
MNKTLLSGLISIVCAWSLRSANAEEPVYRHYTFDTLTENGAATPDSSSHEVHARLSAQELCDGVIGRALSFQAGNRGVELNDLGLQAPATLSFWLQPEGPQADARILSQLGGPTTQSGCLRLTGGDLQVWSGTTWAAVVNGLSDKDVWQHAALVFKEAGTATGYLNGKKGNTVQSAFDFKGVKAAVGVPFLGRYGTPFTGALDDFRIYGRALEGEEIRAMYPPEAFTKAEAALTAWRTRVDALAGAGGLNGLAQALEEAVRDGMDDERAQLCTTMMDHSESEALPITLKAELLTLIVRFGGAESVDYLSALLSHEDPVFHTRAVLGLQKNPSESAAVALRKALADASIPERQARLIHALSERRDSACLPQVVKLAGSKDTQVRNLALHAIALMSDEPRNALFQVGIKQGPKAAKMDAINAYLAHADRLAEMGKKREAIAIYRELIELGGYQKGHALMGLALVGGAKERDFILEVLKDTNERNPTVISRLFSRDPSGRRVVERVYADTAATNVNLKADLLGVLGSYADPATLPTVLNAADDENHLVRRAALGALGNFDDERATDALIAAAVSERDLDIAVQSIGRSPRRSKITENVKKALPAGSASVRVSLVRLLGNCPKAECVPLLLATLRDADRQVRAEALGMLAKAGEPSSYAPVVEFLAGEPDRKVRTKATAALSRLGDTGVTPAERSRLVTGRLMKGDCPGRAELIAMLPRVTSASSQESELKILNQALVSEAKDIRRAATRALQEWPDPDVVLDVLLRTAGKGSDPLGGVLALRAYTEQLKRLAEKRSDSVSKGRMAAQDATREMVQRYRRGLDLAVARPEKSGLLSGLGGQAHPDALKTALDHFDDQDVKEEAMLAVYTISAALGKSQAQAVTPALEKIIAETANEKLKKNASDLVKSFQVIDTLHATAPANAIILFDGTDTSAWMQHGSMRIPTDEEIRRA